MRVLVTGIRGLVGSRLSLWLHAHGHRVLGLTRDPERARRSIPTLSNVAHWDALQGPPNPAVFNDIDAIVHLAGTSLRARWTAKKKKAIWNSRVLGTKYLVQALLDSKRPVKVLICASAVGYYGDCGDREITEHSPPGRGFIPELVSAWEEEARVASQVGVRVVHARFGLILWPRGGVLAPMVRIFKMGLGGWLGDGTQWWSWVHLDDAVGFIERALTNEDMRGAYNVVSPTPVRQEDFAKELGRVLRRPVLFAVPAVFLQVLYGEGARELLKSQRVIPQRTIESGFRFRYSELSLALRDLLHR